MNETTDKPEMTTMLPFDAAATYITGMIIYPVICIVGIVSNMICLRVLHHSTMKSSTNTYLIGLSLGDLIKLLNDLMYVPAVVLKYYEHEDGLMNIYFPVGYFLSQYLAGVTAWITVAVSLERFFMVVYPAKVRGRLSVAKAAIHCLFIYLILLGLTSPCAFRYFTICRPNDEASKLPKTDAAQTHPQINSLTPFTCSQSLNVSLHVDQGYLWKQKSWNRIFSISLGCIRSLIPLTILGCLSLGIIVRLYRRPQRTNKRIVARHQLTRMLIAIVTAFVFLSAPDAIISLLGWGYQEEQGVIRRGVREITDTLLAFNSDVHFFIYIAFNVKFRQRLRATLCSCVGGTEQSVTSSAAAKFPMSLALASMHQSPDSIVTDSPSQIFQVTTLAAQSAVRVSVNVTEIPDVRDQTTSFLMNSSLIELTSEKA